MVLQTFQRLLIINMNLMPLGVHYSGNQIDIGVPLSPIQQNPGQLARTSAEPQSIKTENNFENVAAGQNALIVSTADVQDAMASKSRNIMNCMPEESGEQEDARDPHHVGNLGVAASVHPVLTACCETEDEIHSASPASHVYQHSKQAAAASEMLSSPVVIGSTLHDLVPDANPFLSSSEPHIPETNAADSQDNLLNAISQVTCSMSAVEIHSIASSVFHVASAFEESVNMEESCSDNDSVEQAEKYFVNSGLAPILQTIMEKHGDIASDSPCTSKRLLMSALERVCTAVWDLQALKFVDVKSCHLESLDSAIGDAELLKLDLKWLCSHYNKIVEDMHLIDDCKNVREDEIKLINWIESMKRITDSKEGALVKLEFEIQSLESDYAMTKKESRKVKE